jgi:hypothetical protein
MTDTDDERCILRVVDDLFILTDRKDWAGVEALFVGDLLDVDMSSLAGGGPTRISAGVLVDGFRVGLHANKRSHHMTTNYRVVVTGERATVSAHGYAWNALVGRSDLWETWGEYTIGLRRLEGRWKIAAFRYESKACRGDDAIRTWPGPGPGLARA